MPAAVVDSDTSLNHSRGPAEESPLVLVVDDSPLDRLLAGKFVAKTEGLRVAYAVNGRAALESIGREMPAIVLTDMQMPEMGGLELVERIRCEYPAIPVIVMTAVGSEEIAANALKAGAASYVPKRALAIELPAVLESVLAAAKVDRRRQQLLECVRRLECEYALDNEPALVPLLVSQFQEQTLRIGVCNSNEKIRVGVALEEALLNSIYHGNLEVGSELKQDGSDAFHRLADQRRRLEPYCRRRVFIRTRITADQAEIVIRDEGAGFDVANLPDPTDPENLLLASGRGLLLIRTFMDDVRHNASGNEITMVKRRSAS